NSNKELLGHLLQRYTALLLGVALKYLKDKAAAEDAVQQVFLKVLTHIPKEQILNFKGWLYVLMRNYCLQSLRNKSPNKSDIEIENMSAVTIDKEELYWQEQTFEQVNEALTLLNEEQRQTITL